jgi:putative FmdB family regulatory protein
MTPPFKKEFMPIYDYRCANPNCGIEFEKSLPMAALETREGICPDCPECLAGSRRVYKAPRLNNHPWRTKLAHLPGEIQAIEAGMYEKDSSFEY